MTDDVLPVPVVPASAEDRKARGLDRIAPAPASLPQPDPRVNWVGDVGLHPDLYLGSWQRGEHDVVPLRSIRGWHVIEKTYLPTAVRRLERGDPTHVLHVGVDEDGKDYMRDGHHRQAALLRVFHDPDMMVPVVRIINVADPITGAPLPPKIEGRSKATLFARTVGSTGYVSSSQREGSTFADAAREFGHGAHATLPGEPALGVWQDGAEESAVVPDRTKTLRAALAHRQKAVALFTPDPTGPDSRHVLTVPGHPAVDWLHAVGRKLGFEGATFIARPGETVVHYLDPGAANEDGARRAAKVFKATLHTQPGRVEFIGGDTRDEGAQAFRDALGPQALARYKAPAGGAIVNRQFVKGGQFLSGILKSIRAVRSSGRPIQLARWDHPNIADTKTYTLPNGFHDLLMNDKPEVAADLLDDHDHPLAAHFRKAVESGHYTRGETSYSDLIPELHNSKVPIAWMYGNGDRSRQMLTWVPKAPMKGYHYFAALDPHPTQLARFGTPDATLTPDEHSLVAAHAATGDHAPLHALIDSLLDRGSPLHTVIRRALQASQIADQHSHYGIEVRHVPLGEWGGRTTLTQHHSKMGREVNLSVYGPKHTVHFAAPLRWNEANDLPQDKDNKYEPTPFNFKDRGMPEDPTHLARADAYSYLPRKGVLPADDALTDRQVRGVEHRLGLPENSYPRTVGTDGRVSASVQDVGKFLESATKARGADLRVLNDPAVTDDEKVAHLYTHARDEADRYLSERGGQAAKVWYGESVDGLHRAVHHLVSRVRPFDPTSAHIIDHPLWGRFDEATGDVKPGPGLKLFKTYLALTSGNNTPVANTIAALRILKTGTDRAGAAGDPFLHASGYNTDALDKTHAALTQLFPGDPAALRPGVGVRERLAWALKYGDAADRALRKTGFGSADYGYQGQPVLVDRLSGRPMALVKTGQQPLQWLKSYTGPQEPALGQPVTIPVTDESGNLKPKGWTSRASDVAEKVEGIKRLLTAFGGDHAKVVQALDAGYADPKSVKALARVFRGKSDAERTYLDRGDVGKDEPLPGSFVLGPKYGAFYQNLSQNPQHLTMDKWWSRTMYRLLGSVLDPGGQTKEIPQSRSDRLVMRRAAEGAATALRITPAELQAVLWYHEQRLWRLFGAKNSSEDFKQGGRNALERFGFPAAEQTVEGRGATGGPGADAVVRATSAGAATRGARR